MADLAYLAVTSALRKVAELVVSGISLREGVVHDIDFLSTELEEMRAFISYGSEKPEDPPADEVLRNIRDLSYDVEDSLDDFIVNVGQKPGVAPLRGKGFIKKGADLVATRRINKKICDISKLVREASDRGARYKMDRAAPRMGSGDSQVRMMSKEASDLVGMDRPRAELTKLLPMMSKEALDLVGMDRPRAELTKLLLMNKELKIYDLESLSRVRAVPIVGFGGLGKTTLAKVVFNASKGYFQHTTWVTVSRNPNIQQILSSMLCQVEDPHSSGSKGDGIRDLISRTNKFLAAKRYLIVLDDLWSTEALEILKLALPLNNVGSRVVITTRIHSVAEACCSCWNGHIYNILPLSSIDSWMLFNRRIFGDKHCPPDLVDVAEKILRKCSGVPLIISIVSSLLAYKPSSRPVWEDLLNSFAPIESIDSLRKALVVSYHDLPHHLRVCLLYLSIFPEDYTIECDRIVRCWMSEGFVVGNGVTPPEEVGWSYLTELIDRSLIQPVYGTYDGKLEAFRIHDVVLDFIMSMSTKDNFVSIPDNFWYPQKVLAGKFRRLSIRSTNEDNYIPESVAKSPVRSLFIFDRVGMNLSFKHFSLLRVLDLEDCKDLRNQDIMEISKLSHLRYLNLRSTRITHVPCEIGQLPLLKTLDLRDTEVKELPTSIVKLKNLEHLLCSKMRFPEEIGKMTVLSCLSQVDILWSNLSVITQLGNLSQLRELELWWSHGRESNNTEIHENLAISL